MSLLVVGSVALDSVYTPFGETADALGGSAVYFSVAGSLLPPGAGRRRRRATTTPSDELDRLAPRGIDWCGVERADGESFRWKGKYSYDLQSRETLETRLGVFADFQPKLPDGAAGREVRLPRQHRPRAPARRAGPGDAGRKLVVCDTMNYWIQSKQPALLELLERVDILMVNDGEARELSGDWNIHRAGRWILRHGPQAGGHQAGRVRRAADRAEAGPSTSRPFRSRRCSTRPARATPSPAASWATSPAPATSTATTCGARWSTARRWARTRSRGSASRASTASTPATWSSGSSAFRDLTHVALAEPIA